MSSDDFDSEGSTSMKLRLLGLTLFVRGADPGAITIGWIVYSAVLLLSGMQIIYISELTVESVGTEAATCAPLPG